jgi:uncharacterized membrane protein
VTILGVVVGVYVAIVMVIVSQLALVFLCTKRHSSQNTKKTFNGFAVIPKDQENI